MQLYRARNPKKSPLWQILSRHFEEFVQIYPEVYGPQLGSFRSIIPDVVGKFLDCGNLERGFARIRCDHCQEEHLLAFSCKSRWFCPSCHQKNVQTSAQFIVEHVLAAVPHRHYVLAIPKMLRAYFQNHRSLLKDLCRLAQESLVEYQQTALQMPDGVPAIIMTVHTFGEYLDFHPHIHAIVADGLFQRTQPPTGNDTPLPTPVFQPMPNISIKPLEEIFRAKVINHLVQCKLLPPERVQILHSWKHSGFNVHHGESVPPEAKADQEGLAQYILRNPFSVEKMTVESPTDAILYRSRLNAKINRNFEVFKPTDFIAAITQHIPDKGTQMVRYYGYYSNKTRGVRQRGLPPEVVVRKPGISPPPPAKLPSKKWRDVIRKVWHTDPLRCPKCGEIMRVLAIIDDPNVTEKILRHLGLWCGPPAGRPPPGRNMAPWTSEPWLDDPMPDYENVLSD